MCKTVTIVNRLHVAEAECNNNQIKKATNFDRRLIRAIYVHP